jgi:hypothetical protein
MRILGAGIALRTQELGLTKKGLNRAGWQVGQ